MIGKIILKETLALIYDSVFQKIKLIVQSGNYDISLPESYKDIQANIAREQLGDIYAESSKKKVSRRSLYDILSFYVNGNNSEETGFLVKTKRQKEHIENFLLFVGHETDVISFLKNELEAGKATKGLIERQSIALKATDLILEKPAFEINQDYSFDENEDCPIAHYWCFLSKEQGVRIGKLGIYDYGKKNKVKRVCLAFPNKINREDKYYGIMFISDGKATIFLSKHINKDRYDDEYSEYAVFCLSIGSYKFVYKSEADIFWGIFAGFNSNQRPVYGSLAIQTPDYIGKQKLKTLSFSDFTFFNENLKNSNTNIIYYELSNKRKVIQHTPIISAKKIESSYLYHLPEIIGEWNVYSLSEESVYVSHIEIRNDLVAICHAPYGRNLNGTISHLDEDKLILCFSNKIGSQQFYIVLKMYGDLKTIEGCYISTLLNNLSKGGTVLFERNLNHKEKIQIISASKQPQEYMRIKSKFSKDKSDSIKNYVSKNSLIGKKWYVYRLRIKRAFIPTIARSVLEILDNNTVKIYNISEDKNNLYEGVYSYLTEKVIVFDLKTNKGDKVLHIQIDYQNLNQEISLGSYIIYEEEKTVRGALLFEAKEGNLTPAILSRKHEVALFNDLDVSIKKYLTFKNLNYTTVPRGIATIDDLQLFLESYDNRETRKRKNRFLEQEEIKVFISSPSTSIEGKNFQRNKKIIEETIVVNLETIIRTNNDNVNVTYLKTNKIDYSAMPVSVPISLKDMLTTRFFIAILSKTETNSFSLVQLGWALAHCKEVIVFYQEGSISEQIKALKDMEGVTFESFQNFEKDAIKISNELNRLITLKLGY